MVSLLAAFPLSIAGCKKATSLPLKYHGWKLVNKSDRAGAYLTIYVICGTLRYLTDDLVTATMHEKLTPLSFAIEPEIDVNNSSVTETKRLLYRDKTFSFSTSAIHLVYNLFNEMC